VLKLLCAVVISLLGIAKEYGAYCSYLPLRKGLIIINRLIVNTISNVVVNDAETISTDEYKIGNCIGCTHCWLKTPGICAVKDDWETLFKRILQADAVIFIAEAKLGFVSYKLKNIVDRLIPLVTPYTVLQNGEMRHKKRYAKTPDMGLIYSGNGDKEFLSEWLGRVTLNFFSKSLGVYSIAESEVISREFGNIQLLTKT